jgi:myo-inositol-1(or 4)-monophosphatase
MGSATADSMRVAHGELDAYWHSRLSPWDIAASALFVQLAGGHVTRLDGSTWHVFSPDILASNGILHDDLLRIING